MALPLLLGPPGPDLQPAPSQKQKWGGQNQSKCQPRKCPQAPNALLFLKSLFSRTNKRNVIGRLCLSTGQEAWLGAEGRAGHGEGSHLCRPLICPSDSGAHLGAGVGVGPRDPGRLG